MKWYDDGKIVTNPGDPIHIIYAPVVNDDGTIELVESGRENTDDKIQSGLESTDLRTIIQRYMNGDIEALNQRQLSFGDTTVFPQSYAELLQLQINAKQTYDKLPNNIKEKFNNDTNQFFAQAGTEEWYEKLGYQKVEEKGDTKTEAAEC